MPEQTKNSNRSFFFVETISLCVVILFLRFWTGNPVLAAYNLQFSAFLIIFYFLARFLAARNNGSIYDNLLLDTIIFTAILLLVLAATGSLDSPLFFAVYFYLFAVALLFEPLTSILATLALSAFFVSEVNSVNTALQLFSLLLFSPLAIYFGRQYLKLLQAQEKIKILAKKSRQRSAASRELAANITSEETDSLLWLSLDFKDTLLKIIHQTSELLSDLAHLTLTQKEHLQSIYESAKKLLKSGEKLKEKIDKETD